MVDIYNDPVLYMRQVRENSAIFIEQESSGNYICYRLTWEHQPAAGGTHEIAYEKVYCRGSFWRCLSKGKSVADYLQTRITKNIESGEFNEKEKT